MSKLEKKLLSAMGRAIDEFNMFQPGDRIMVCLSGGKDSFALLRLLHLVNEKTNHPYEIFSFTLDQQQPGWDDSRLRAWLERHGYAYEVLQRDTYSVVLDKVPEGKAYCSMCGRMRRGIIYRYAAEHGYNKIALGHHSDDLIQSLLMSILYSGEVRSMPPKMLSDDKQNIVVRPLAYCREQDIAAYAEEQEFPIIPCNLCGSQPKMTRAKVRDLIASLEADNDKVPANILNAIGNVQLSQLMDQRHWDFAHLEQQRNQDGSPPEVPGCGDIAVPLHPMDDILSR